MGRIPLVIVTFVAAACSAGDPVPQSGPAVAAPPQLADLIAQLASQDATAVKAAQEKLRAMGPSIVPVLFDRLLQEDWTVKPRLLEVLIPHGQEFVGEKLLNGDAEEQQYAALLHELRVEANTAQPGTPEYRAMSEALVRGLESDDKNLRALSALGIGLSGDRTLIFENYYKLVPALIATFDVPFFLDRGHAPGPWNAPFWAMCVLLDQLIGGRLAYAEMERKRNESTKRAPPVGDQGARRFAPDLERAAATIEELRSYWNGWWNEHSDLPLREIGILIIDRNLDILARNGVVDFASSVADSSLDVWTDAHAGSLDAWRAWWRANRASYAGPISQR